MNQSRTGVTKIKTTISLLSFWNAESIMWGFKTYSIYKCMKRNIKKNKNVSRGFEIKKKVTMLTYICKGVGFLAGPMITVPVAVVPTSSSLFESSLDISRSMERWLERQGQGMGIWKLTVEQRSLCFHKVPCWAQIPHTSPRN